MDFDSLSDWARSAGVVEIALISLALNVATLASSVTLWQLERRRRSLTIEVSPVVARDVGLSASTTLVNSAILLPAWALWKSGVITIADPNLARFVVEVLFLVLGLDVIMYGVHRLFHYGVLYDRFHSVHHLPQKPPSALTLFVMSPFEAAGFGLVVMVLMWTWPVSLPAVAIFFTYNLVVGTAAHLPRRNSDEAPRWWDRHLGGSVAHLSLIHI